MCFSGELVGSRVDGAEFKVTFGVGRGLRLSAQRWSLQLHPSPGDGCAIRVHDIPRQ